jgi:hypothetical protein
MILSRKAAWNSPSTADRQAPPDSPADAETKVDLTITDILRRYAS